MKNLNIFNKQSSLYLYRWVIVTGLASTMLMAYYDLTGRRMFEGNTDKTWSTKGPGYHK